MSRGMAAPIAGRPLSDRLRSPPLAFVAGPGVGLPLCAWTTAAHLRHVRIESPRRRARQVRATPTPTRGEVPQRGARPARVRGIRTGHPPCAESGRGEASTVRGIRAGQSLHRARNPDGGRASTVRGTRTGQPPPCVESGRGRASAVRRVWTGQSPPCAEPARVPKTLSRPALWAPLHRMHAQKPART